MTLKRGMVGLAIAAALALAVPASAGAVDIIEAQSETAKAGWQAGTCTTDAPVQCSPETDSQFFTQAAGHPDLGFTQFIVKHESGLLGGETPVGDVQNLLVDLPAGLSVNPQATPQCELAEGESPSTCETRAPDSKVGTSTLTAALVIAGTGSSLTLPASPVFNLVPKQGQPARFGFSTLGNDVYLEPGVDTAGDYHEFFYIHVPKLELPSIPLLEGVRVLKDRLVFEGNVGKGVAGRGAFLTNPSTCLDPEASATAHVYSTFLHADSYEENDPAFPQGAQELESPLPKGVHPEGCDRVPFEPGVKTSPNTDQTDTPFGPTVEATVPDDVNADIANSNVRTARVTMPLGAGLNPASASHLEACTDSQFGKGTTNPVGCPAGSEVGTVDIETPVLPPSSLTGRVFLGQQLSRDPTSGNEYRIFVDAESPRYGQSVRLIGNVSADPRTGQLTATISEAPQLPFTSVSLRFDGGKGVLTSPPTCGPNVTSGDLTPWSGTADAEVADAGFTLTKAPGGGNCAKSLAERPFSPGFEAKPGTAAAKTYTPFTLQITRSDGQQEIKGVDLTLPPGATARLAGVPYCSPADIAKTEQRSGADEKKSPACPEQSRIGNVSVLSGSGPSPLKIQGEAFLAGPYEGAPISFVIAAPALAGPFDLGTDVVRVPIMLDPETAQINPDTNQIPDVFGGAKIDIRSIFVNVNRQEFTLNGSNCRQSATSGSILGGGSDPTNPAAFSSAAVSDPFRGTDCKKYKFKPKLRLRLYGKTKRNQHPKLRAELAARTRDSNIGRASVALPHSIFLDQASLGTVCTRVQFAASACPKRSVYGHARAFTPLLGKPLEGPVYLRSSNNTLPDLVAHLRGQVTIDLVGRIDSFKGGIRTTFGRVPDVPVKKFVMTIPGGRHGLLVSSTNLCARPIKAVVQLKAQNGRKANKHQKLRTPCRKRKGKKGKKHR